METWYLLYGGQSTDGRGDGIYMGRTTDERKAKRHQKICSSSHYSTGYVIIITDQSVTRANSSWK